MHNQPVRVRLEERRDRRALVLPVGERIWVGSSGRASPPGPGEFQHFDSLAEGVPSGWDLAAHQRIAEPEPDGQHRVGDVIGVWTIVKMSSPQTSFIVASSIHAIGILEANGTVGNPARACGLKCGSPSAVTL